MPKINFQKLKIKVKNGIEKADNLKVLDEIFRKYLGEKGEITALIKSFSKLPEAKRAKIGREINQFKAFLEKALEKKVKEIKEKLEKEIEEKEWIDVTIPGKKIRPGHLHPLSQVREEVEEIFQGLGFSVVEGPEVETEWYNFDALNIPKEHPARDLWDTFWLKPEVRSTKYEVTKKTKSSNLQTSGFRLLLRTHTTPVDVRYMEKNNPPLRIITIDRCFRHEATDASHEINFYQLEGLMVGKNISVANFKATIQGFFQRFFNKVIEVRMRPGYFPFVEPGFEVDMTCLICGGKGCSACQKTGWMEMMGAGMVHPAVFKNSGLNPNPSADGWQGWAFGMGFDRLAMMKYKINDIRLFYSGDLRFLQQF